MPRHTLRVLTAIAATAAAVAACATNPVTGRQDVVLMSEAQEMELGRQEHAKIMQEYARYEDESLQAYVNEVGQRIVAVSHRPNVQFTFTVLDSDEINAFAIPGYVYVTRGIMAYLNSEAELTAVLGHEVGHVTARHAVRQQTGAVATGVGTALLGILTQSADVANVANMAGSALVSGYGRDMELEADGLGSQYLVRLGYNPDAMIDVVRLLKNQEMFEIQQARAENRQPHVYHGVFASHPDNDTRLHEVVKSANNAGTQVNYKPPGRDQYLERVQGLPFGSSSAQGVVKGSRFYHADMGFTVAFPSGWSIKNTPQSVYALPPQRDALLTLAARPVPPNVGPREFLAQALNGVPVSNGEDLKQYGLTGYTVLARNVPLEWGTAGTARFAVIYMNGMAYIFKGSTRLAGAMSSTDPLFVSSIRTFRRLKDTEYELADANRIQLIKATPQTTIEALAKTSPIRPYPAEQLRLLNDLYPSGEPAPGTLIKVVK